MSCIRSLDIDLLRNTQNSKKTLTVETCFSTLRSILRPFPCVKGLVIATGHQRPYSFTDTSGTRKVQKTAHTVRWDVTYNMLLTQCFSTEPLYRNSHVEFALRSLHKRNVQQFGHFPCCCGEFITAQLRNMAKRTSAYLGPTRQTTKTK